MKLIAALLIPLLLAGSACAEQSAARSPVSVLISVADQKLCVLRNGRPVSFFPVSTSKFGLGDQFGSCRTPLGKLRVSDKVGANLRSGAVLKGGRPTGEVLPPNSPGRDPIVTRILRLQGDEPDNKNAGPRGIYIHGTPEEKRVGRPASYGCVRMRSRDVIQLFNQVPVGSSVVISDQPLRRLVRAGRHASSMAVTVAQATSAAHGGS